MTQAGELNLSVVMIAMNEERTIGQSLAAVQPIASELIVVDSGSADRTQQIAGELGAKVIQHQWSGYAAQKNFALDLAACDWVLNIDADEILSPQLVEEIRDILTSKTASKYAGCRIPRVLYIGDHPAWHGGFYPDAQLRLIQNGKGRFNDRLVHESIQVDGPVGTLKNHMLHKSYRNLEEFSDALDKYARLSAQEFSHRDLRLWQTSLLNQFLHPVWTFFYRYILRAGFLDGLLGLKLNLIYSGYVGKKIRYLRAATENTHR